MEKRIDLTKFDRIQFLSNNLSKSFDVKYASELIHLVYSTNPEGQERKISLNEKLSMFNCSELDSVNLEVISENNNIPNIFFILGLFIGDGSLGFVFNEPKARAPNFYFKPVFSFVSQKSTDYNIHLLTLVVRSIDLEPKLLYRADMVCLEYIGNIIFEKILPFFAEYKD